MPPCGSGAAVEGLLFTPPLLPAAHARPFATDWRAIVLVLRQEHAARLGEHLPDFCTPDFPAAPCGLAALTHALPFATTWRVIVLAVRQEQAARLGGKLPDL